MLITIQSSFLKKFIHFFKNFIYYNYFVMFMIFKNIIYFMSQTIKMFIISMNDF